MRTTRQKAKAYDRNRQKRAGLTEGARKEREAVLEHLHAIVVAWEDDVCTVNAGAVVRVLEAASEEIRKGEHLR